MLCAVGVAEGFKSRMLVVLVTVAMGVCAGVSLDSQDIEDSGEKFDRGKRSVSSQRQSRGPTNDQLFSLLEQYESNDASAELLLYTPSTPSPGEVDCYVQIPVTRRVGGRCVNLGNFVGCQAGIYLALDNNCSNPSSDATEQPQATRSRWRNTQHPRRRRNAQRSERSMP